jgi:hypothetical protein
MCNPPFQEEEGHYLFLSSDNDISVKSSEVPSDDVSDNLLDAPSLFNDSSGNDSDDEDEFTVDI